MVGQGRRRLRMLVAILSLVAVLNGAVVLAAEALPGDLLYPVKRLVETTTLRLWPGDDDGYRLELAGRRVAEADVRPGRAPSLLAAAIEHMASTDDVPTSLLARARELLDDLGPGEIPAMASTEADRLLGEIVEPGRATGDASTAAPGSSDAAPGRPDGPGQSDDAPGRSESPRQPSDPPGQSDAAPGQNGTPGQPGDAPSQSEAPGQPSEPPGQSGETPSQPGNTGPPGDTPDQSDQAPGQSDGAPGQSDAAPGQSDGAPGGPPGTAD